MKRSIFDELLAWKNKSNRYPLILQGARQVGKTYALKEFGKQYFEKSHYVNFEDELGAHDIFKENLSPCEIIDKLSFHLQAQINIKCDLVIFDEIQACPQAITSLKYFSEKMPELHLVSSGSLLGISLGESSFPVGKVDFLNMYPMSFEEFLEAVGELQLKKSLESLNKEKQIPDIFHKKLWNKLKEYFVTGGLPSVIEVYRNFEDKFEAFQKARNEQDRILGTYMADIAKHSGKQNSMHIERVFRSIPQQLSSGQDGNAAKFKFKDIIVGKNRYADLVDLIDWLLATRLVIKVPFVNNVEHPLTVYVDENQFRLFIFDIGILGALSNLAPSKIMEYDYGTYKGFFAENFICQEFVFADKRADRVYTWKSKSGSEIEFLRDHHGDILPIEVKSGFNTRSKSLQFFAEKHGSSYRTIMSANNLHIDLKNQVHRYPLYLASRFPLDLNI
jgi:predicted AAA+ superfamily ATPase